MTTPPSPINPLRGQIWRVDLDPTRGAEISKARPCVVVSANGVGRLPLRLVVPITEWSESFARYSWMVRLEPDEKNGLTKTSTADTFQTRSASLERFQSRVGAVSETTADAIATAIANTVDAP